MRYGVNVRRLEGQRLGIGRYIEYLLQAWTEVIAPGDSMELYLREPLRAGDEWIENHFDTKLFGPRLTGVTWENLSMAPRLKDLDVFFGPSYSLPLAYRGPCVVATHSLTELTPGEHPFWYMLTFSPLYRLSALKAKKVIVPSHVTLQQVHDYYRVPLDRLEVVREGAPDSFAPIVDPDVLSRTRIEYTGQDKPYILFVGKFSERRNIPTLIRAFAQLKKSETIPHNLLLLGPNHLNLPLDDLVEELGVADSVTITNRKFARHADIVPVYSAASLYAFPSSFEGASNTVVEAMSCGLPVVAGRCDAIADILEGSGTLIDSVSVDSVAEAIADALTTDTRRVEMRERGLERSKSLRWSTTAKETLDIMQWAATSPN